MRIFITKDGKDLLSKSNQDQIIEPIRSVTNTKYICNKNTSLLSETSKKEEFCNFKKIKIKTTKLNEEFIVQCEMNMKKEKKIIPLRSNNNSKINDLAFNREDYSSSDIFNVSRLKNYSKNKQESKKLINSSELTSMLNNLNNSQSIPNIYKRLNGRIQNLNNFTYKDKTEYLYNFRDTYRKHEENEKLAEAKRLNILMKNYLRKDKQKLTKLDRIFQKIN